MSDANIVVMAEDNQAYNKLLNMSLPNTILVPTNHDIAINTMTNGVDYDGNHSFGSPWYKRLVTTRPQRLLSVLCSTDLHVENLIYADVDSVWRENPIPYIESHLYGEDPLDIVAQVDNPDLHPVAYCTGLLAVKNNDKVKQLLWAWERAIADKWKADAVDESGDQPIFGDVIHSQLIQDSGLKHGSLPILQFPSGRSYFNIETTDAEREKAAVVHNN